MPERGDLLLVPFPFTDLSAVKRRPVLAVTASDSHDRVEINCLCSLQLNFVCNGRHLS
jgi:hypothetical protein